MKYLPSSKNTPAIERNCRRSEMIHSDFYASDVKEDYEKTMSCRSTNQFSSGLHKAKDRLFIFIRRWHQKS